MEEYSSKTAGENDDEIKGSELGKLSDAKAETNEIKPEEDRKTKEVETKKEIKSEEIKAKEIKPEEDININEVNAGKETKTEKEVKTEDIKAEELIPEPNEINYSLDITYISSNINCIKIFESVLDTAESFKIQKYIIDPCAIKSARNLLPENFKLVSVYGILSVIKEVISQTFQVEIPNMPRNEGIYLFYNKAEAKGILAFLTEDEGLYKKKPIKSSSRLIKIIRTLTDLSTKLVACISEDLEKNWFYENRGTANPYVLKTHSGGLIKLVKEALNKPGITSITTKKTKLSEEAYLTNDGYSHFYDLGINGLSLEQKKQIKTDIDDFCTKILNLDDKNKITTLFQKLCETLKMKKFSNEDLKNRLTNIFKEYDEEMRKAKESFISSLIERLENSFEFKKEYNLSKKLTNLNLNMQYDVNKSLNTLIKSLPQNSKLKSNTKFEEILNSYYKKYTDPLIENYNAFVDKILLELSESISFKEEYGKLLLDDHFCGEISNIKDKLNNNTKEKMKLKNFIKKFDNLKSFIETSENRLKLILDSGINDYFTKLNENKDNYLKRFKIEFNKFDYIIEGSDLLLYSVELKVNSNHTISMEDHYDCFEQFFDSKPQDLTVNQVVRLDKDVVFIFISDRNIKKTQVFRFKPKGLRSDIEKCQDIDNIDVKIATGSTSQKYIMFYNEAPNQKAVTGSLIGNKTFGPGIEFPVYKKIKKIRSSHYMQKSQKLYILDDEGVLYYKELVHMDGEVLTVKTSSSNSEDQKEYKTFQPQYGGNFMEINVSSDEHVIYLRTELNIECYDKNLKIIEKISVSSANVSFKAVINSNEYFILLKTNKDEFSSYRLIAPKEETKIVNKTKSNITIPGNPIFDVHYLGINKFGPLTEDTQLIIGKRSLYYYFKNEKNTKIYDYLRHLDKVANNFTVSQYLNVNDIFQDVDDIEKNKFLLGISVSIPIHIASVQRGNLIPLQNGMNNFEKFCSLINKTESYLDTIADYIKFGSYEEIFEKHIRGALVISIMGRQSSGKSYLLNRIAGTRFDVAAERCTDGLWMGVGFIFEKPVIVFDCEGLFTVERTPQEEVKLCLFLSSLSDIIILNSDLSSGKHLKSLFKDFSTGVDRLKGSNLFRGYLDITYRDIGNYEAEGASLEFNKFFNELLNSGKSETLAKLFQPEFINSLYHNFENPLFEDEVRDQRITYIDQIRGKWDENFNLCNMIKYVLGLIYCDDNQNVDITLFQSQSRKLRETIDVIINDPELSQKELPNDYFENHIQIEGLTVNVKLQINRFYKNSSNPLEYFMKGINFQGIEIHIRIHHNEWYSNFNDMMKQFFDEQRKLLVKYYKLKLPNTEEFIDEVQSQIPLIENKIDKIEKDFELCLRKCEKCDFKCIKILNHRDRICNCGTDHICKNKCDICLNDAKCFLPNGHESNHFCNERSHQCSKNCSISICHNKCSKAPKHENECLCSSSHPCGENCKFIDKCGQICTLDLFKEGEHSVHTCKSKCPFKCIFDERDCINNDHFHDDNADLIPFTTLEGTKQIKKHLCGAPSHKCTHPCGNKGICGFTLSYEKRKYENAYTSFTYDYAKIDEIRNKCTKDIPRGDHEHQGDLHACIKKIHLCGERCPECNCICKLDHGHDGLHHSETHRNKESSKYISLNDTFENIYSSERPETEENPTNTKANIKTVHTFIAGASAAPEHCNLYCETQGRGHLHPVLCKGGDRCLEKIDKTNAIHSNQPYKVGNNESKLFDFQTCRAYWGSLNWRSPCHSNQEIAEDFEKCNFYCNHPSHKNDTHGKSFCELNVLHSREPIYNQHTFKCVHEGSEYHDIVFIVDCTGSMGGYFSEVKMVIENLIKNWKTKDNKFSIVGYTDHDRNSGDFDSKNPVKIFPDGGVMDFGQPEGAANFINNMRATGGGGNGGEALIDGLYYAANSKFRADSSKIFILICDDTPHGSEFNRHSEYQAGCPCKYNWRHCLQTMKNLKGKFIFVVLDQILNQTVEKFRSIFANEDFQVLTLIGAKEIQLEVTKTVDAFIQENYVFSSRE